MPKQIAFSGVQPSGELHIGNYLGAIQNWVGLQEKLECIFCIVDLHAITVPQDPKILSQKILETAKIYLAAGIDPDKSLIFIQSQVPAHSELAWILGTIARIGELERMTQFKEKARGTSRKVGAGVGLFTYPVLMAADILLYKTNVVPVGEDQKQHVELARDLAKRFNNTFGKTFIIPEALIRKKGMRIMGLDGPNQKMSKSASSSANYIALLDNPDTARQKIMKAVTDSGKEIIYKKSKPAISNLLTIHHLFSGEEIKELEKRYENKGYAEFKKDLADLVARFLTVFQERYNRISDKEVMGILEKGAKKANELAGEMMREVKNKIGLV